MGFGKGANYSGANCSWGGSILYGGGNTNAGGAHGGSGYIGNPLLTNKHMTCYNCTKSTVGK